MGEKRHTDTKLFAQTIILTSYNQNYAASAYSGTTNTIH